MNRELDYCQLCNHFSILRIQQSLCVLLNKNIFVKVPIKWFILWEVVVKAHFFDLFDEYFVNFDLKVIGAEFWMLWSAQNFLI